MNHPIHELSRPNLGQDVTVFKDLSKMPVHRLLHSCFPKTPKPTSILISFAACASSHGSLQRKFTPLSQISGCLAAMKCLFRMVFVVEVRSRSPDEIHQTHRYIRYDEPTPFHVLSFLLKSVKRVVGRHTSPGRIEWSDGVSGEFMKYKGQPVSRRDLTSTARNGMVDVFRFQIEAKSESLVYFGANFSKYCPIAVQGNNKAVMEPFFLVLKSRWITASNSSRTFSSTPISCMMAWDFTLDEDKEEWFHYSFVVPLDRDRTVFGEVCTKIYKRLGFGFDLKSELGMRSSELTSDMQVNRHGIGLQIMKRSL
jgi:hypothetical protein